MILKLPHGALEILDTLEACGHEAYVVGGCVRDSLLGIEPDDWDICTSARPELIKKYFEDNGYRVIETGLQHGTVTVVMEDGSYEVTTFRCDGHYSDGRHPDTVEFVTNLHEDLARRDFTINAMAYNPIDGLIDPFDGEADLNDCVIRCVGNANERFEEDALRIFRALRFASRFGFEIEFETHDAMVSNVRSICKVSGERINMELCKFLQGFYCGSVMMKYHHVFGQIIYDLQPCIGFKQNNPYHNLSVYGHTAKALQWCASNDIVVLLAVLFHDVGKPYVYTFDEKGGHFKGHPAESYRIAERNLSRLRFDNETKRNVLELIEHHDATIVATTKVAKRWLNKLGKEQLNRLLVVRRADRAAHTPGTQNTRGAEDSKFAALVEQIIDEQQCFSMKDLAVNGKDVLAAGFNQGPAVGQVLNYLLNGVIDELFPNERDVLLEKIQVFKKEKRNELERNT